MNDFRDVLGSKMSTGMKQKVSIARTIVHDPPVLIFDEPTSGLDVLVARAVLQNILELRDRGKTIVFSTHSMHEVEKLCSRVAIIHKGRVQAEGAPRRCWISLTSRIWRSYSSTWSSVPIRATSRWFQGMGRGRARRVTAPSCRARLARNNGELPHALVEPLHHFPPRGSRPDSRPAHAVHDLRAADLALSDPGDRRDQVCDGARAEAAGGGRRGGRVPAQGARAAESGRRRLRSGPFRHARRGRAAGRAAWSRPSGPWGEPRCARAGHPRRRCRGGDGDPRDLPAQLAARHERDRHPDPVQQRRRAQPDHVPATQRAGWSAGARASSTAG